MIVARSESGEEKDSNAPAAEWDTDPAMANRTKQTIWVVVRIDHYGAPLDVERVEERISLREAVPTLEEAEAEARRLNELGKKKSGVHYFAAPVAWFPEGRNVEIGY